MEKLDGYFLNKSIEENMFSYMSLYTIYVRAININSASYNIFIFMCGQNERNGYVYENINIFKKSYYFQIISSKHFPLLLLVLYIVVFIVIILFWRTCFGQI